MLWCSIGFRVGLGICFAMVIVGAVLYQGKVLIGIDVQSVCACLCLSVCVCVHVLVISAPKTPWYTLPSGIPYLFELFSLHLNGSAQDFVEILMVL